MGKTAGSAAPPQLSSHLPFLCKVSRNTIGPPQNLGKITDSRRGDFVLQYAKSEMTPLHRNPLSPLVRYFFPAGACLCGFRKDLNQYV